MATTPFTCVRVGRWSGYLVGEGARPTSSPEANPLLAGQLIASTPASQQAG